MKTLVILAAVAAVLVAAGAVFAAGPFGPPEPEGREDETSMGIGFFHRGAHWKPGGGNFGNIDIQQNLIFAQAAFSGYGFAETGAFFVRAGAADFDDGEAFKDTHKPFGSVGVRDVWYGERTSFLQVGTVLQGSYFRNYAAEKAFLPGSPLSATVKSMWDVAFAVVVQANIHDKVLLYAGPMGVYGRATVERTAAGVTDSTTYTEKSPFGGIAGARISVLEGLVVEAEGQYQGRFSAGGAVAYSF